MTSYGAPIYFVETKDPSGRDLWQKHGEHKSFIEAQQYVNAVPIGKYNIPPDRIRIREYLGGRFHTVG